jgi:hypothetical protein
MTEYTIKNQFDEWETFDLSELDSDDFRDTELIPEGYDLTTVPKCTDANFRILVEKHNELVKAITCIYVLLDSY